jgi:hypothetical protein
MFIGFGQFMVPRIEYELLPNTSFSKSIFSF